MHKTYSKTLSRHPRRIRGQGMTEYIIIVALIALGAVVAVGFFGNAVKSQFVAMGAELVGGDGTTVLGNAVTAQTGAETDAGAATSLGTYTQY